MTLPQAGRYRIWFTLEVSAPAVSAWGGQIAISAQGITAKTAKEEFIAAKDGILAIYNGNYFRFHSSEGLLVRIGNYGLRLDANGISKMTNGQSWQSL